MTSAPSVAILTPTYQHSKFIIACVASVLAQTVGDWEMVVVDDGSDDGTPELVENMRDSRITLVRQQHRGLTSLAHTYSVALERSSAPLVAVLEGDDMWPSRKLETQLPLMGDRDVVLSYGSAGLIDEYGCQYAYHRHAPRGRSGVNEPVGSIIPALVRTDSIVTSTVLLRRAALEAVGGFRQPRGIPYVDLPTWLGLATLGPFARSKEVLGYWRRHSAQWTIRSALGSEPDRTEYLTEIASAAERFLRPHDQAVLRRAVARDRPRRQQEAAISRARLALIAGNWRHAASMWTALLAHGELRTRLLAAVGLACAGIHTDVEWTIRAAGRHSYASRRHMLAHRGNPIDEPPDGSVN